jgi:branched-chain amino acid transport system substrate-binding protein
MKRRSVLSAFAASLVAVPQRGIAQQAGPLKIGFTVPLTGPLTNISATSIASLEMGIASANKAGGAKGRQLVLATEDTQGTPAGGIAALRKLVQVDGVQAIVTIYTNVVVAQMPLADELKVPTISPIEIPDIVSKSQYSFAHSQTIALEAPLLRDFWKRRSYKKIYALLPNNSYGTTVSPIVNQVAVDSGAAYTEALYDLAATDYRGVVTRVRENDPDAIFISGQGSIAETKLMQQLREGGVKAPFFNPANNYFEPSWNAAGKAYAEGMYYCGLNVDEKANPDFVREAKAKLGHFPTYPVAEFYDMARIYAFAINKGGYSGPAIRDAVATLTGFPSAMGGRISMGPDHYSRVGSIGLWQVRDGQLVRVSS